MSEACWNIRKEKLLCHMLLDDGIAQRVVPGAAPAYWRAFIVQDRETGIISAKFRFRKPNGDRDWHEIIPALQNDQTVQRLRRSLEAVLRTGLLLVQGINPEHAIKSFYPPDDGGDPNRTIIWLEQQDLIEEKPLDGGGPGAA